MKKIIVGLFICLLLILPASAAVFNKDLKYSMRKNPDVVRLQKFLTSQKLYSGSITGNYFSLTLKAVKKFQKKYHITPANGYFNKLTRAAANKIINHQKFCDSTAYWKCGAWTSCYAGSQTRICNSTPGCPAQPAHPLQQACAQIKQPASPLPSSTPVLPVLPSGQNSGQTQTQPKLIDAPKQIFSIQTEKIVINPLDDTLLASTFFFGTTVVYYSENRGETWKKSAGIPDSTSFINFTIDKVNPNIVYAVDKNTVYLSGDKGKNFQQAGIITSTKDFYTASITADSNVSGKIYVGHHNFGSLWGLYTSSDQGRTFNYKPFSLAVPTTDIPITQNRIIWDIKQDQQNQSILYTSSEEGNHKTYKGAPHLDTYYIVRSLDDGKNWQAISSGLPWHSTMLEAYADPNTKKTTWLAGTEGLGLFALDEEANTWNKITTNIAGPASDYLVDPTNSNNHFFATWTVLGMSSDGGKSWSTLVPHKYPRHFSSLAIDSLGNLYISDYKSGINVISKEEYTNN